MKTPIVLLWITLALAGCDLGGIRGNRRIVTEEHTVRAFTNLDVSGGFQVDWRSGSPSASVTADQNLMGFIELRVSGNVLHVRTTRSVRPSHSIKLTLTGNSLEGARFSGASRFTAHAMSGARFSLETSGASKVNLDGAVGELVASMTGASNLRAESLKVKAAELSLTGASDAHLTISETLKVSITGAGKVEYGGNPPHIERHITGAGTIRKRD